MISDLESQSSSMRRSGEGSAVKLYLLLYNVSCTFGWLVCLLICLLHLLQGRLLHVWSMVEYPLKLVQTFAVFEIIHSLVKIVKSPVTTVAMQILSRLWMLWAILNVCESSQTSYFFALAISSWSMVEVPRYSYYTCEMLTLFDVRYKCPSFLVWLRYSLFLVLYPTGIAGEIGCMYIGLRLRALVQ